MSGGVVINDKGGIFSHSAVIDDNKMPLTSKGRYEIAAAPPMITKEATRLSMKQYDNWFSYRF